MPNPRTGESRQDFLDRCIPMVLDDGAADSQEQAVAMCSSMFEDSKKKLKAYGVLTVKRFDNEARIIEGIASTPTPDRMDDVVDPLGVKYSLPIPLLWQHDSKQPIGEVYELKATEAGLAFKARLAKSEEPGRLKERLDEAYQSLKLRLVRGISIGFRGLKHELMKGGGILFKQWELLEISAVTIPANAEASILNIRALSGDPAPLSRQNPRPPSRQTTKIGAANMASKRTIADQIRDWEATRASHSAICQELLAKSDENGETLDQEQSEKYEEASRMVKNVDQHLNRLREQQQQAVAEAKPIMVGDVASPAVAAFPVRAKRDVAPHIRFARYVMDMAAAQGVPATALEWSKRWDDADQTEIIRRLSFGEMDTKAVPGTVPAATGQWGDDLVYPVTQGFLELLMPATILGKISGWYRVPFNVRVPIMTAGMTTVNWVAEAAAKPVGEMAFDVVTLTYAKIAGIVVLSEELVRLSTPSAQQTVSNQLVRDIAKFIDLQLLDSTVTETTSRPAALTNGVTGAAATGTDLDAFIRDLNTALATFDTALIDTANLAIVTTPALGRAISGMLTPFGSPYFPTMNPRGGTVQGFQVVVSPSCPSGNVIYISPENVLLADDGGVSIDASTQATLDMAGGNSPTFSLWQKNCIGVRAERWIRWKKARSAAVTRTTGAAYVAGSNTL